MKITVIGSGHGGSAIAAILAKYGYKVNILKLSSAIHNDNYEKLKNTKKIKLKGIMGIGEYDLNKVTNDPAEVIPDAEIILIYYVSNYHRYVAESIAPYIKENQVIIFGPGYLGSLILEKSLKNIGKNFLPLIAEFETLPYTSRIESPGCVNISSKNVRHPFATYPATRTQEFLNKISPLFEPIIGKCVPRNHIIEVALHNPNLIIHTVGVLLNVAWIENEKKDFAMYRNGFSPSIWNIVKKLDAEKMNVLEKLGAPRISYFEAFIFRTFEDLNIDPMKGFLHYANEAPEGPFTINNRYITEDVPMGLGLLYSLGKALNVPVPICTSLINIADALLPDQKIWANIRTIESLCDNGIEKLIKKVVGKK